MKYRFNEQDWFVDIAPIWEKILIPYFKDLPINVIELGSFEGRSATWLLDNVLTHPQASIDCVDIWRPDKLNSKDNIDWKRVKKNLLYNLGLHGNKARFHEQTTFDYLKSRTEPTDLVYVDAGHNAFETLTDGVFASLILKPGGLIVFDDYLWTRLESNPTTPKPAIDAFINCFSPVYSLVFLGYQVILRKNDK